MIDSEGGLIEACRMKTSTTLVSSKVRVWKFGRLGIGGVVLLTAAAAVLAAESPPPKDLGLFFQQNCARCHGANGDGRDATGKHLRGAVFTTPQWQQNNNDTAMAKVILKGKFFGLAMPAFKDSLSQDEALRLVRDILHKQLGAPKPRP
ncbi:MAG: cytochrome c [bacterium]